MNNFCISRNVSYLNISLDVLVAMAWGLSSSYVNSFDLIVVVMAVNRNRCLFERSMTSLSIRNGTEPVVMREKLKRRNGVARTRGSLVGLCGSILNRLRVFLSNALIFLRVYSRNSYAFTNNFEVMTFGCCCIGVIGALHGVGVQLDRLHLDRLELGRFVQGLAGIEVQGVALRGLGLQGLGRHATGLARWGGLRVATE